MLKTIANLFYLMSIYEKSVDWVSLTYWGRGTHKSVSDLKLYEIQASRACNFIKFLARLEITRPQKWLCQQSCCQRAWRIHIVKDVDNPEIATLFMNMIIFPIGLFLITLLFLIA